MMHGTQQLSVAGDIEIALVLPRETGFRKVFGGGGAAHSHICLAGAFTECPISTRDHGLFRVIEGGVQYLLANPFAAIHKGSIAGSIGRKAGVDSLRQMIAFHEGSKHSRADGEPRRKTGINRFGQASHLAEARILAANRRQVRTSEIFKPDNGGNGVSLCSCLLEFRPA